MEDTTETQRAREVYLAQSEGQHQLHRFGVAPKRAKHKKWRLDSVDVRCYESSHCQLGGPRASSVHLPCVTCIATNVTRLRHRSQTAVSLANCRKSALARASFDFPRSQEKQTEIRNILQERILSQPSETYLRYSRNISNGTRYSVASSARIDQP
jgi:hypothetical protein